jgi:hypothetical protein
MGKARLHDHAHPETFKSIRKKSAVLAVATDHLIAAEKQNTRYFSGYYEARDIKTSG